MKIKFLGTAAAEGMPALFCSCDACKKAMKLGGKEIRTRFQIMIDDDILIDFPSDSLMHMINNKLDFTKVNNIFITHQHLDHFDAKELSLRATIYTNIRNNNLTVHGNKVVTTEVKEFFLPKNDTNLINVATHKKNDVVHLEKYDVVVLEADHMTIFDEPFIYFFHERKSNKNILFAHDTGYFKDSVWEFLRGKRLDMISIDCTFVQMECTYNHLGIDGIKMVIDRLIKEKVVDENTLIVVNHFSHNAQKLHFEIEELVNCYGWIVAFDGMDIEV